MHRSLDATKRAGLYLESTESDFIQLKNGAFAVPLVYFCSTPHPNCPGGAAGVRGEWGSAAGRPKEGAWRVSSYQTGLFPSSP